MTTYDFDGEKYQKASKHQKEWGNALISGIDFKGDERVLDLGCGDGILTAQLAELVPDGFVIGVDASSGMIEKATEHQSENLEFRQMDINDIDFQDEFDVLFSNATLHWIKDHSKLLDNAYRALKLGGTIVWNFAGDGNCSNFYAVMRELMASVKYRDSFDGFVWPWFMPSLSEYERLSKESGFSQITVSEENADRHFKDVDEMVGWMDQPSLVPFMAYLPDELKDDFRDDSIKMMVDRTLQPDGTCFETFRRIKVTATR